MDEFISNEKPDARGYMCRAFAICPSLIMGSVIMKDYGSTPSMFIPIVTGKLPRVADCMFGWADIQDISEAHWKVIIDKSIKPDVFIISETQSLTCLQYADILRKEFGP